jgi:hypothetical protein
MIRLGKFVFEWEPGDPAPPYAIDAVVGSDG